MKEKALHNLIDLLNRYYKRLEKELLKELETKNYSEIIPFNTELEQLKLEYEVSIFKNIDKKGILFEELFGNKPTAYFMTEEETEILRTYIGIYNDGKKQSLNKVAEKINVSQSTIDHKLKRILISFITNPTVQKELINERNERIRENIREYEEDIKKLDISFLNITDNLAEIFRLERINTIEDIIKISIQKIKDMNIKYGFYSSKVIFPKRLIDEIQSLGLNFKNKDFFERIYEEDLELPHEIKLRLNMRFETIFDILSSRQFEPEILNTIDIMERLNIKELISNPNAINEMFEEENIEYSNDEIYEPKEEKSTTKSLDNIRFESIVYDRKEIFRIEYDIEELKRKKYYMS